MQSVCIIFCEPLFFCTEPVQMGCVIHKVGLGQDFLRVVRLSPVIINSASAPYTLIQLSLTLCNLRNGQRR